MKDFTKGIMVGFAGGLIYAATNLVLQGYRVDDDGILRYKREDHQESESDQELEEETSSESTEEDMRKKSDEYRKKVDEELEKHSSAYEKLKHDSVV